MRRSNRMLPVFVLDACANTAKDKDQDEATATLRWHGTALTGRSPVRTAAVWRTWGD